MARTDTYLDAMLRHLGAAYYESLHGRATRSDVHRALDTVEEHMQEAPASPGEGEPAVRPRPAHAAHRAHADAQPRHHRSARRVGDVMTTSVVTVDRITPYQDIARLMTTQHVRRLPVTDVNGKLIGIVTRRDLLSAFLRPDADISRDARQVIDEIPFADPAKVIVMVHHGVVTLTGMAEPPSRHQDLVALAIRMIWDVDGVVDVRNRINEVSPAMAQERS